jgi:hypothetical protein
MHTPWTCLLELSDLSGSNWKIPDQKVWRTGIVTPRPEWSQRARDERSFTPIRSLERVDPRQRLWTEVVRHTSHEDPAAALTVTFDNAVSNPLAEVALVPMHELND